MLSRKKLYYWAGFFFGDGTVSPEGRFQLRLSRKDRSHLESLCDDFGVSIRDYVTSSGNGNKHEASEVSFTSHRLAGLGESIGLVPNKTERVSSCPAKFLGERFRNHWIRGYFDADGSVCFVSNGQPVVSFTCMSDDVLQDLRRILLYSLHLNNNKIIEYRNKNAYKLSWKGSKQVSSIREFLYSDAELYLQRKKDVFDRVEVTEKDKVTDYIGVSLDRWTVSSGETRRSYYARIRENGKQRHIGSYSSPEEAAKAYDEEAKKLDRETNFDYD